MKKDKDLIWVVGLVIIVLIICGTLIYINHNSWAVRFEMDDNIKEAIKSIDFDEIGKETISFEDTEKLLTRELLNEFCKEKGHNEISWYSCGQGIGVTCTETTLDGGIKYPCHSLKEVIDYVKSQSEVKDV